MINEVYNNDINLFVKNTRVRGDLVDPVSLPKAKISVDDSTWIDLPVEKNDVGKYEFAIESPLVANKHKVKLNWSYTLDKFGDVVQEEDFYVKSRLISYDEYVWTLGRDIKNSKRTISYEDYSISEYFARNVVETYCNQEFTPWTGTRTVFGSSRLLSLPQHLEKINWIREDLYDYSYNDLDINPTYSIPYSNYRLMDSGSVIDLRKYSHGKESGRNWKINGDWGYKTLPQAIKIAGIEMVRDFSTDVVDNRRQYLLNTSGSNDVAALSEGADLISWRAYVDSTGNAIVDQTLLPYRIFMPYAI